MKQIISIFLLVFSLFGYSQVYQLEEAVDVSENEATLKNGLAISQKVVEGLLEGEFEAFMSECSDELLEKMNESMLSGLWKNMTTQYGEAELQGKKAIKVTAEKTFYLNEIAFGETTFDIEIALNEEMKISSLMLKPAVHKGEWTPPEYAAKEYESNRIVLDQIELNAELVTPLNDPKTAIIVMVHGSGPNDMDGSLGPNKILKDIALGMASEGIASLRYNKRTFDFPSASAKMANELTIDDIVTNDAVAAINQARSLGYKKVILLGHSLGGHIAPKIAEKITVEGVVIMAGNASPMIDLLVPQYEYLLKNDSNTAITEFQLNAIKAQVDLVKNKEYNESTPLMMLPLSLPPSFWKSLEDYSPTDLAKKQKDIPYLVLNGDRDYQVTVEEAKKWKSAVKNKLSKTIIYSKLNHMFYKGEGILIPSEYEIESHVDESVIADILTWIKSL